MSIPIWPICYIYIYMYVLGQFRLREAEQLVALMTTLASPLLASPDHSTASSFLPAALKKQAMHSLNKLRETTREKHLSWVI